MPKHTDYSQHGEQETILAWAAERKGGFIDLGAYDGSSFSNTAALADRGWSGLCIDAAPDAAAVCAARYMLRDDVQVLLALFRPGGETDPGNIEWSPGEMYTSVFPDRRVDVLTIPLLVPPVDLAWLVAYQLPRPLFVSIDLEGGSIDAAVWVHEHLDPDCMCVEANVPGERDALASEFADWRPLNVNAWNSIYTRDPVAA